MSTRYAQLFRHTPNALIPFLMLGDPDPEASLARIEAVIEAGADALELGLPFSDPVADGPTVVAAANRARAAGTTPAECFRLIETIRSRHPDMPIGLLVYANLVFARGLDDFYARAAAAGVDSVLVPDLPLQEAVPFRQAANRHGIAQVFIAPPDAGDATLVAVAQASVGYTYVLGRRGVTGAGGVDFTPAGQTIARLRAAGAAPPVIGFGIDGPDAVRAAFAAGARGVIVGSALLDCHARGEDVAAFIASLCAATPLRRRLSGV